VVAEPERSMQANEERKMWAARDEYQRRLDIIVSLLGSLTLPMVIGSGIFGMNSPGTLTATAAGVWPLCVRFVMLTAMYHAQLQVFRVSTSGGWWSAV
jgi:hypothetical protein